MPVQVSYPGVYVQENPSGARSVAGVSTASTAFVDYFGRGPMNKAVQITNFRDFERIFGGLHRDSESSYGLLQYFNNGGSTAWVVRVGDGTARAAEVAVGLKLPSRDETLKAVTDAADAARKAADAAKAAAESSQKPEGDSAQAQAMDLAKKVGEVADDTSEAARQTQAAAAATDQASKQLAIAVQIAAAAGGALAEDAKSAANDAATAADDAAKAAQAAADAAKAAKEAADALEKPAGDASAQPDSKKLMDDAVEAAEKAADAAKIAAEKASDAQVAAESVREGGEGPSLVIRAANPGSWGNALRVAIESFVSGGQRMFRIKAEEVRKANGVERIVNNESYQNLSLDELNSRYAVSAINSASSLIQLEYRGQKLAGAYPEEVGLAQENRGRLAGGTDGGKANATALLSGMTDALDYIAPNVFNILCLPSVGNFSDGEAKAAYSGALQYCQRKRAFLIMDTPPGVRKVDDVIGWTDAFRGADKISGAVYFPRLVIPDPLNEFRPREVGPSGSVAGIFARTDTARGVWKAPAGIEAGLRGADLVAKLRDEDSGTLNPLGINVLRSFPVYGNIVWGARTLAGADLIDSEWKYVPVRRLTNYIEESLFQSLKWVVFEPNDERTWAQIRLQVGSFLAGLFAQGAFQGQVPDKAYFVNCDSSTTTQTDIDRGIVNIIVGFAPLKPAEFVILQIEQIAGQA
ncbi:MAG TPA: phage tail sheath C-terminal domain-containing protein [Thermoanaerobaculia bacterium]|nr:phage tail sheath C-terminal domain-containing protein [Thermoanaerobaculia bacterium]